MPRNFTNEELDNFIKYCEGKINLSELNDASYGYTSMAPCLIDCVCTSQAKYRIQVIPLLNRYANRYMHGDRFSSGVEINDLVDQYRTYYGLPINSENDIHEMCQKFANEVYQNRQVIRGKIKSAIIYDLACTLQRIGINTINDIKNMDENPLSSAYLEREIKSVYGVGDALYRYLLMLTGDETKCKPDTMLRRVSVEAFGYELNNDDLQELLTRTVERLHDRYPSITVRKLDNGLWNYMSNKSKKRH